MRPFLASLVCILALATGAAGKAFGEAGKPRLVSLDYCADQFVLALADREQIMALSPDAHARFSHFRDRARGLPVLRAGAEDVLALAPDIVVRSWGGDRRSLALYERLGIRTVETPHAMSLEAGQAVLAAFAEQIGQRPRGEAILAALAAPAPEQAQKALYLTPGGVSAGRNTMIDAIITHAGLRNANTGSGWTGLDLEGLVLEPPSLILAAFFGFGSDAADHWSVSRHPVMRQKLASARVIRLDEARISCGAWFAAEEASAIAQALGEMK